MAITSAIARSFLTDIMSAQHAAANSYKMALYDANATLDQNTANYTSKAGTGNNELAAANGYNTAGAAMANYTVALNGTGANITACLTFNNVTWGTASFTARGCMIYNDTLAGKNTVAVFDFGNNITGGGGNFTVNMPVADFNNALVRIK